MSDPADPNQPVHPDAVVPSTGDADPDAEGGLDLGALLGGGEGGFDFGALLQQASEMQAHMAEAQEQVANQIVEGVAGGEAVRIIVSGDMEFQAVTIDPSAVDPAEVEMLQDLILAALHDAVARVQELQAGAMGGFDLGGIDLGDMGGLLGDGVDDDDAEDDDDEGDGA